MGAFRRGMAAAALTFGLATSADATLIDQLNGTVLDTDTNLLWLKDANYADIELDQAGRIDAIIANVGSVAGHPLVAGDFDASTGLMTWWGAMARAWYFVTNNGGQFAFDKFDPHYARAVRPGFAGDDLGADRRGAFGPDALPAATLRAAGRASLPT